jgi:hypothetical protein
VRKVIYRMLPARLVLALVLLLTNKRAGLAATWGYGRSLRLMRPEDAQGQPIPWLPYCAVELLMERLQPDLNLLEFGAGYSTMFFMRRVARVTSVEHHERWIELLRPRLQPNVAILHASQESAEAYTAPVRASSERFDVILVDGQHRVECFQVALERLTPRGVIILDDSDRPFYARIFELGAAAGFRILHVRGHKADSVQLHRTSFFYRDGNCLGF